MRKKTKQPTETPDRRAIVLGLVAEWQAAVRAEQGPRLLADGRDAAGDRDGQRAYEGQAGDQVDVQCRLEDRIGAIAVEWFGRCPLPHMSEGLGNALALVVAGWVVVVESGSRPDGTTVGNPIPPSDVMTS